MMSEFTIFLARQLFEGVRLTLLLLVCCGTVGNLLAVPLALARVSDRRWLKYPAFAFILLMRGTPVLVQLYWVYYGVGELLAHAPAVRQSPLWPFFREAFGYAFVALSLNTAAYSGEILRGAIQSIPAGQSEAGRSLGLSPARIMFLIVLPQAFRNALPALSGQTVLLLKATALASTITIFELMGAANFVRAQTFRVYEPLLGAAIFYVVLTFVLTRIFGLLERRLSYR
jgi:polar amino acid transport system permease protein